MALAAYAGPTANHAAIMEAMLGETIQIAFIDADGRIWLVSPSGHALTCAGLDRNAPAWSVEPPHIVQHAVEKRRQELRNEINAIKRLAPGIDV